MDNSDLRASIKASVDMLNNIEDHIHYNSDEVNNKALLNVSTFINNVVLKNNGKQLLLFDDKLS